MNILVPDSWLRDFLVTEATPEEISKYVSLCGPSIERMHRIGKEIVYDIEVTSNRPDSMSVVGVAREASAILRRFGIKAILNEDPYLITTKSFVKQNSKLSKKQLIIETDSTLNPRWTSILIDKVKVGPSPVWLKKRLKLSGIRSLNNVIDTTNFIIRAYGQPVHAFDFNSIKPNHDGISYMKLRVSRKNEKLTTLDGKTHTLPGGDIVIEDGSGKLIDLCGIMGGQNSSITAKTKTVLLFMQTYDPAHIRKTSMSLTQRTEAAALFEKGLDPELILPAFIKGTQMLLELTGGKIAGRLTDIYPHPYTPRQVSITKPKLFTYLGTQLTDAEITQILSPLGFMTNIKSDSLTVSVPSFRRDVEIDVDIIEEIARIYGYHNIKNHLPDSEPPVTYRDPELDWEDKIKVRLRDWGFTETYTYSMISEELMDIFKLDKQKAYKISNPLSSEWVYMRPSLWPSLLSTVKQNLNIQKEFKLFELSKIYKYQKRDLPQEISILLVAWVGEKYFEAKGLAESIFDFFGISKYGGKSDLYLDWYTPKAQAFSNFGSVGVVNPKILNEMKLNQTLTVLELDFELLVSQAQPERKYIPIPKYPPVIEDLSFVFPPQTPIGQVISEIKSLSKLINTVSLLDQYENTSTFRIHYLDREKPLSETEVTHLRHQIITRVQKLFAANLKSNSNLI